MLTWHHHLKRFGKQRNLAISLFCYLIADAFLSEDRILAYTILAMMIVSGPMAADRTTKQRLFTVALAVLMIGLGYLSVQVPDVRLIFSANLVAVAFFFLLIYLISKEVLIEQSRVTSETLWAAINVYLLIGLLFAFLYGAVLSVDPGAFSGGVLDDAHGAVTKSMVYYSFVTMTTLGYGDITPKIQPAATLAYVQALIGQLYVAILIARLVSMYNTQSPEE